jgi:hypothetical protein
MVKPCGRLWYYVGIAGTVALITIWTITRFPNPITEGRGLPINSMSIVTELFDFTFVILTAIIVISKERSKKAPEIKQKYYRFFLLTPPNHDIRISVQALYCIVTFD